MIYILHDLIYRSPRTHDSIVPMRSCRICIINGSSLRHTCMEPEGTLVEEDNNLHRARFQVSCYNHPEVDRIRGM